MTRPDQARLHDNLMTALPTTVVAHLAPRERQIVQCVAEGYTNREIALQLGISAHTVRNILATVFIKTGASNRVVLTRLVLTGSLEGAAQ